MERGSDGWRVMIAYSVMTGAMTMLWLSFAAITTETARHYGVSVANVGLLAEIFPVLFVALAIPAGKVLDRLLRPALIVAVAVAAAGGLLRCGGDYAWALAGQFLIALAQPVVLSAGPKLVHEALPQQARASALGLSSAINFIGMILAFAIGPVVAAHGHVTRLLYVEAVIGVVAMLWLAVNLRAMPTIVSSDPGAARPPGLKEIWRSPSTRILCGVVFAGFGIFIALVTWTQQLLKPAGVSQRQVGVLLVGMVVLGVIGCVTVSPAVIRRGIERRFVCAAMVGVAAACAVLALAPWLVVREAALVGIGLLVLPGLPIILHSAERLAGPASGSVGALVWMAGNLGGLVVAVMVQIVVHQPRAAFLVVAGVALLGLAVGTRLPASIDRTPVSSTIGP